MLPNQSAPDQKNIFIALLLSMAIIFLWQYTYERPRQAAIVKQRQEQQQTQNAQPDSMRPTAQVPEKLLTPGEAIAKSPRLKIASETLHGSVALQGARFDNLSLAKYRVSVRKDSPEVTLLSPTGTKDAYFVEFGWSSADSAVKTPDAGSLWQADQPQITPGKPVTLRWQNGQGLEFQLLVTLDEHYLFTVEQRVVNRGPQAVALAPYALINRAMPEAHEQSPLQHEGPLGVLGGTLTEVHYDELREKGKQSFENTQGWAGITDKYWLTSLIPAAGDVFTSNFSYYDAKGQPRYQVDYLGKSETLAPGETSKHTLRLFAGAKVIDLLDSYAKQYQIPLFDRAVDLGVLHFLTKPIFQALDFFYSLIGNFGLAIMALTVVIKLLMFPLANKSYVSMGQMKRLQPEMTKLRERHADDKMKFNQELMNLYKREKVNPMSGCLPLLIQLPVFFALYKVLYVTIEMRHTPFYGWINDLSAPDPTNLFTLFGLIPWTTPSFLHLGIWPIVMCATMVIQQKLNPPPSDPMQARIMNLLPFFFLFLFASFPAGLVIYWSWSNLLSILQQWFIMQRHGEKKGKPSKATS